MKTKFGSRSVNIALLLFFCVLYAVSAVLYAHLLRQDERGAAEQLLRLSDRAAISILRQRAWQNQNLHDQFRRHLGHQRGRRADRVVLVRLRLCALSVLRQKCVVFYTAAVFDDSRRAYDHPAVRAG
ncbi:hypothetical protein [Cohnella rhizosphaerae]|uniref:Uncharacterized protein n=1 Tax=Cohnella rhizosphaerae TaxID=1457232 RepID=A0A9X4KSW8_9BACL|nr:hypothetical protein [Cohnella rhizosphaerae]MDG0808149.1 hypothetical protein [Cohnella rhizosphaerae]